MRNDTAGVLLAAPEGRFTRKREALIEAVLIGVSCNITGRKHCCRNKRPEGRTGDSTLAELAGLQCPFLPLLSNFYSFLE